MKAQATPVSHISFISRILFALTAAAAIAFATACSNEKAKNQALKDGAEAARKAVGIDGADDYWRCAGVMPTQTDTYMTATLQKEKARGQNMLTVAEVTVKDKSAAKVNTLFVTAVTIEKKKNNVEIYTSTNSSHYLAEQVGAYDYTANIAELSTIRVGGRVTTIDCNNNVLK